MDKNDIELLEFAAKAASIVIHRYNATYTCYESSAGLWNPLLNDGDALRLAVKLHLDVMTCQRLTFGNDREIQISGAVAATTFQPVGNDDPCAATRLAIVRAAAEIGKQMEVK